MFLLALLMVRGVSVLIFPLLALSTLRRGEPEPAGAEAETELTPEPYLM